MLVNGTSIDTVSINDRGLSYGDGVFETIRLHEGHTIYLQQHLERLLKGCQRLKIKLDLKLLEEEIGQLSSQFSEYAVLKIIISRETGGRGYRPTANATANRILSLHTLPSSNLTQADTGIHSFLCQQRLALQPALAGIKHLNRLEQVLASQEWPDEKYHEGIMLDINGNVIEGTKSNLFLLESNTLITPDLTHCGVDGVMRKVLIAAFNTQVKIEAVSLSRLLEAKEVFVCNSVFGVWPLLSLTIYNNESNERTGTQLYEFTPGNFCLQARQVFENALTQHAF